MKSASAKWLPRFGGSGRAAGSGTSATTATEEWPAAHPTTVINLHEFPSPVKAAVCIRCDWLARAFEDGHPVDLHDAAKGHALAHPHDSRLERGVNPPRRRATSEKVWMHSSPRPARMLAEQRDELPTDTTSEGSGQRIPSGIRRPGMG